MRGMKGLCNVVGRSVKVALPRNHREKKVTLTKRGEALANRRKQKNRNKKRQRQEQEKSIPNWRKKKSKRYGRNHKSCQEGSFTKRGRARTWLASKGETIARRAEK